MGRKKQNKASRKRSGSTKRTARKRSQSRTSRSALNELMSAVRRDPADIQAALSLAEYYNNQGTESKIVGVLEPLENSYPFGAIELQRSFDRLLAFGYAHASRFADAERVALRGLGKNEMGLDYLYVLTFVKLSLREFNEAISFGTRFLSIMAEAVASTDKMTDVARTVSHLSQLHNFLGSAYQHNQEFEKAIASFEASLGADSGNHLPYINLATLYRRLNRPVDIASVVKRGLKNCRQVQELRLLDTSTRVQKTVSACMIVKNEEELLPECLQSIRDWVDEIIVIDTGSSDRTVEIAREYGAQVLFQEWEGDFSKHRNFSLEQATCDYVFIIDADERIFEADVPLIKRIINEDKHPIISINVFNVYGANQRRTTFLPSVRIFRRDLELRYDGIVHNRLSLPEGAHVARTAVRLKHLGYDLSKEKMEAKYWRSRKLLEKQLDENPDDVFALFNYAQLLRGEGEKFPKHNAQAILKAAGQAVKLTDPKDHTTRHLHLMCLDQMGWTYGHIGEYDKALEICDRALAIRSDYLDPLMLRGHIYSWTKEYDKAEEHFHKYIEVQAKYDPNQEVENLILVHPDSRPTAFYSIAVISLLKENKSKAREYLHKVTEVDPDYLDAWFKLGQIYLNDGEEPDARRCFERQLQTANAHFDTLLGLGYLSFGRGDYESAVGHYSRAVILNEDDSRVRVKLGKALQKLGRIEEASVQYEAAVARASDDAETRDDLADLYFQLGRYNEAADAYRTLIKSQPDKPEHHNDLANALYKMGSLSEAASHYGRALESPNCPPIANRNLGLVLARQGKAQESIIALERYVSLTSDSADVCHLIGDQYFQLKKYEKALPVYERSLGFNPNDPLGLYSLSECYLAMGHRDSAILGYRRTLQIDPQFKPARDRLDELDRALAGARIQP